MSSPGDELPRFRRALFEASLRQLEHHPNGLVAKWPGVMRVLMGALVSDKWTDEDEACLDDLAREADRYRLFEPDDAAPPPLKVQARAVTALLLATGHSRRLSARSGSPWPEDQPGAARDRRGPR